MSMLVATGGSKVYKCKIESILILDNLCSIFLEKDLMWEVFFQFGFFFFLQYSIIQSLILLESCFFFNKNIFLIILC